MFLDDEQTGKVVMERFDAGHEFDDCFVVKQLCGREEPESSRTRVLLVGAPIDMTEERNSRMFLNIRPTETEGIVGDGLLYRLDTWAEKGDSELALVGTALEWVQGCFLEEVDARLAKGDPGQLVEKRYPGLTEKRQQANTEREHEEE